jgi:MFS family permease
MTAPALVDYKSMLDVSTEIITHYYTLFSIGTILGALCKKFNQKLQFYFIHFFSTVGFLFKYINRQLTLIIILVLFAFATALSPQCPNFILFYLCGLIAGLGAGTLDTVQTVWLIEMWDEKSGSILQLSEGTYGLGCFIGPLIVEPFLAG